MDKVKERIIEYMAVARLTGKVNGQVICFVGPPGVGKTSIAKSIADALGRRFVRMSLGGIRDEAEIRGHRRTYIGAMPGRVISAMRQAGVMNPVILFDEIDKLAGDYHGDPAAAMLEVLDSAQNFAFRDHFIEVPYDLSKVMFLTTANDRSAIPAPLLDRMEVIEVPGYLETEKIEIAKRHLLPKQMEKNGLKKSMLTIPDPLYPDIIRGYTAESGVRSLERVMGSICRKAACDIGDGKAKKVRLTKARINEYLGRPRYNNYARAHKDEVGLVNGLAWTSAGGDTLEIEVQTVPGSGKLMLTGQLGDVMQESAKAALTFVHANAERLGIDEAHNPGEGYTPARARRRCTKGRPQRRHHHGCSHSQRAVWNTGKGQRSHDRRNNPSWPRAADRRPPGKASGCGPGRHDGCNNSGGEPQGSGGCTGGDKEGVGAALCFQCNDGHGKGSGLYAEAQRPYKSRAKGKRRKRGPVRVRFIKGGLLLSL